MYPRQPPYPPRRGTSKLTPASPTGPLVPPEPASLGQDRFQFSTGRFGSQASLSVGPEVDLSARLEALHAELGRAKATIFQVRARMAILKRALRLLRQDVPEQILWHQVPLQEKLTTQNVARHVAAHPEAHKAVEVALGQYEAAWDAMRNVEEALMEAQMLPSVEAQSRLAGLSIEKMRGQVFPLASLPVQFEQDDVLGPMFPHVFGGGGGGPAEPYRIDELFRSQQRTEGGAPARWEPEQVQDPWT